MNDLNTFLFRANFWFWIVGGLVAIIFLLMYIAFWKDKSPRRKHNS